MLQSRRGTIQRIIDASEQWAECGLLAMNPFRSELAYFCGRYVEMEGKVTPYFRGLQLPRSRRDLVTKVLTGNEATSDRVMTVVLIIVYRLRCNLFHGLKSLRELPQQRETLDVANTALMRAIELHQQAIAR